MNWSAIGAIGELLGGTAVIVSLVYLAIQIRQNTRALQTSAYHQAVEQAWHANLAIAENRDLLEIVHRGAQDLEQLDPKERLRFTARAAIGYGPRWIPRLLIGVIARFMWDERRVLDTLRRGFLQRRLLKQQRELPRKWSAWERNSAPSKSASRRTC